MKRKTCIFIRHALTQSNIEKRYAGNENDEDILPVDAGIVKDVRERIDRYITGKHRVVSGPMKRSRSTAALLFPESNIVIAEDLTEIGLGMLEGKTYEDLKDDVRYRDWIESRGEKTIPGGEPVSAFIQRSMDAFGRVLDDTKDSDCVVVVCHGGNIMAVMSELTGEDYYGFYVANLDGYVVKADVDGKRISVVSYDRIGSGTDT